MKIKNYSRRILKRRQFLGSLTALTVSAMFEPNRMINFSSGGKIIKPPKLKIGDTVGLIAPASAAFEPSTIREGVETLESLGFKVKIGKYVQEKYGYLAGTDVNRVKDLHQMFSDDEVKAIISLRGGYGSMRLLNLIDYDLIKKNPKIFIGYSDITSLNLAIYHKIGLVTFHGPVAISSFSKYTQHYFFTVLTSTNRIGEIKRPEPDNPLRPTAHLRIIRPGRATGRLVGGNLTLFTALLGTPYEVDTRGAILFLEETGEEPYDIDRMLTQLLLAGKLDDVAGIIFDKCPNCKPADYKPAFFNTFSLEEILVDRLGTLNCPTLFGLNVGHETDKPTLPLGINATLDADQKVLIFEEAAVM